MISRRSIVFGLVTYPILLAASETQRDKDEPFAEVAYPDFGAISAPEKFGLNPPTEEQRAKAQLMINNAPVGPHPIDVAQSFIDRYSSDPKSISQWPKPEPWNPLIAEFFNATSEPANNDMIPWCAAFANWCLERANHIGSKSPSSQSFLSSSYFKQTQNGERGDLAIFTCYDRTNQQKSLPVGHVAFLKDKLANDSIRVIGGNQRSAEGTYFSIICEKTYPTKTGFRIDRTINGRRVSCILRFNTYIKLA
jgi:uncharacterized protein (TIGR02594 family)